MCQTQLDVSSSLKTGEAFLSYSCLDRSCSAHEMDTHGLVGDQAPALLLAVFSPSWEIQSSAVWSTPVLASRTHHHHTVENTEPTGKQGSSVSGADSVTSLTQLLAARLGSQQEHLHPQLHLQLSSWPWI